MAQSGYEVFAGSADGCVYTFHSGSPPAYSGEICTGIRNELAKVSHDGRYLFASNLVGGGTAVMLDLENNCTIREIEWDRIESIDMTPDGEYYAVSGVNRVVVYRSP